ncbi:MAG: 6-carboxytetrahydropterin synthase QueD [Clostridiales bacterium]
MSIKKSITKIFTFDSAHRLIDYDGACKNVHGHTYKLEVTFKGELDSSGMIVDFHDIDKIIKRDILRRIDHLYLNEIFDFNPTCENIAIWIFENIEKIMNSDELKLKKIILWETPTSFITIEDD